jgi:hypothetical protein
MNGQTLEQLRETWGTFEAGAAGWRRAVELAQQRFDDDW